MRIWTFAYRPWIMGGNVNAPVMCDVPVTGPYDVGKGLQVYLATSPSGRTFVAESITGALVGPTVPDVRADVELATKEVMDKQIEDAKSAVLGVHMIAVKNFWMLLRAD